MDNEMIERCAKAVRARDTQDEHAIVRAVIKAMREPTEKMLEAGTDVGPDRAPSEYWYAMIDAIINE